MREDKVTIMDDSTERKTDLGKRKRDENSNENFDDVKLEWLNRLNRFDICKRKMDETSTENSTDGNELVESIRKKKRLDVPSLDEFCARFPKLRTEIAEQLDNENVMSLKMVSRQMNQALEEDRSFWL